MSKFSETIFANKYAHTLPSGRKETWPECAKRVAQTVMRPYLPDLADRVEMLIRDKRFIPGGRYLYATGRPFPQVNNCFLFRAEDSREGWADVMRKATNSLMTGGGIGVVYSRIRCRGSAVAGMGGESTGPVSLAMMVNEAGRGIRQGGSRRSAIWAGLHWNHPDIEEFIAAKNWPEYLVEAKRRDFNAAAPLDMTNISVILDDEFFSAHVDKHHRNHTLARRVYSTVCRGMCETGEPGFSVDCGDHANENLRNACTEVTSEDDSDMCNLGSLNMARFDSVTEFENAVQLATAFLLCGTLYSVLPMPEMVATRNKNRRLGLGLMGLHEFLLKRDRSYGPCRELDTYMCAYAQSGKAANWYADKLGISRPVATRAIAPTGTISIIAGTTSGIEPIFATAYKRRYLDGSVWKAQYVIDATAKRLIDDFDIDPKAIESSYDLARDPGRRFAFQQYLQWYVDHGISSTINLPKWGSKDNNEDTLGSFSDHLMEHLPRLRGITAYPDGSRGGQPLVPVTYEEARRHEGHEIEDGSEDQCMSGVCGI